MSYLAQTAMRSEIGLLDLDSMFKERESLNAKIRAHLDHTTDQWGIECMRYEIKDILPPKKIQHSMELQAEAERIKRSFILESEGKRQSMINNANSYKQAAVLQGEGEAAKILNEARAVCESLDQISSAVRNDPSGANLKLKMTERYLDQMSNIMEKSKIIMLPKGNGEGQSVAKLIASSMGVYGSMK